MNIELMDVRRQHLAHKEEFDNAVLEVLSSGNYIGGKYVKNFEDKFAAYYETKYAISCGNGTDALVLALKALNIGSGDEVITTPFTFFATAEAIANVGAKPVFVDVNINDFCIDCNLIEEKITKNTKAILPVHIYGQSCDMDKLREICDKHNLKLVTDCAQSTGTRYKDSRKKTLGDVACFSFFPTKILGCDGDGGMVLTDDENVATAVRAYKLHGSNRDGYYTLKSSYLTNNKEFPDEIDLVEDKYHNYLVGYNSRLDAVQANLLSKKLDYLDKYIEGRRNNADCYNSALKNSRISIPKVPEYSFHTYYVYALQSDSREEIMAKLKVKGVATGVYYPVPLHLQPAFYNLGYKKGDMPNAEFLADNLFVVPVYPELFAEELEYIANMLSTL